MKTLIKIFFTVFILQFTVCISAFAQNLVPNPSFEDYCSCPDNSGQVYRAIGWTSFGNSSDYFNCCAPPGAQSVPLNPSGYQCAVDSGTVSS